MALLNVNIDHVATIRQARKTDEPDPVWAAVECELAGANGITVHLRQDRRHINDRDVHLLKETVASKFNLEMCLSEYEGDIITYITENGQSGLQWANGGAYWGHVYDDDTGPVSVRKIGVDAWVDEYIAKMINPSKEDIEYWE